MIYFNRKKEYKGVKEETTIKIDLLKIILEFLPFLFGRLEKMYYICTNKQ